MRPPLSTGLLAATRDRGTSCGLRVATVVVFVLCVVSVTPWHRVDRSLGPLFDRAIIWTEGRQFDACVQALEAIRPGWSEQQVRDYANRYARRIRIHGAGIANVARVSRVLRGESVTLTCERTEYIDRCELPSGSYSWCGSAGSFVEFEVAIDDALRVTSVRRSEGASNRD